MTQEYRNIKIRTNNADELRAVQELLFLKGCKWRSGDTNVSGFAGPCIFVSPDGLMTHSDSMRPVSAQNLQCKEVFFDFKQVTTTVATLRERPKTVLFGKTYFTDELNARLAGLETA